jgi:hypothetical protein
MNKKLRFFFKKTKLRVEILKLKRSKMTNKQRLGLVLGLAAVATGAYLWYKNQPPKFKILETNNRDKTVKWQYGRVINVTQAGQSNTYSNNAGSDFFIHVGPIEEASKAIGVHFNFLGKDEREPIFVYFE